MSAFGSLSSTLTAFASAHSRAGAKARERWYPRPRAWLATLIAGCGSPTAPTPSVPVVWNPVEYEPPSDYARWAAELGICMRRPVRDPVATVRAVKWVAVDAIDPGSETYRADEGVTIQSARYAVRDGQPTVYLLRGRELYARTVKHELTHHLLWTGPEHDADAAHRGPYWDCKDR